MGKLIYITDRSRIDTREECERKRYLNFDFDVDGEMLGIQRREAALALLDGTEIHDAFARLLAFHAKHPKGESLDVVAARLRRQIREQVLARGVYGDTDPEKLIAEQAALLEGLLRSYEKIWIPHILEEFDVVSIEEPQEWILAPGLISKHRFDVVLRRKTDKQLVILDYKTFAYTSDTWARKLERSRQTSLYILAAQEMFGESVEMMYLGMAKGSYRIDTAFSSPFHKQKIQASPFCYAYALKGDIGTVYQTAYTSKKGFKKVRAYEEMTPKEWFEFLWHNEEKTVREQFSYVGAFSPTQKEMNRVRELVVREELEYVANIRKYHDMRNKAISEGNDDLLEKAEKFLDLIAAPMRENTCNAYGADYQCAFYNICFSENGLDNALEDGAFMPRIPHHETALKEAA